METITYKGRKVTHLVAIDWPSGDRKEFYVPRRPAHFASWAMRQMPYGTVFTGAKFTLSRLVAS